MLEETSAFLEDKLEDLMMTVCYAARRIANYRLVKCSSGNLSCRHGNDQMLVSASGAWMETMTPEQIAVCQLSDGTVLNDACPSIESGIHFGILNNRPDINVVIHYQSLHATTIACYKNLPERFDLIPEIPYYIGEIGQVEYQTPGTTGLAKAVTDEMKHHNLVILRNHGQVVVGKTFAEATQRAVFFELACEIMVNGGDQVGPMTEALSQKMRDMAAGLLNEGYGKE